MSYKISKELFEAVMNVKLTTDLSIAPYYNEVNGCEEWDLILINYNFIWIPLDTFFFKCKEWLLDMLDIDISTKVSKKEVIVELYIKEIIDFNYFHSTSEQQAVFDACQWILENKGVDYGLQN